MKCAKSSYFYTTATTTSWWRTFEPWRAMQKKRHKKKTYCWKDLKTRDVTKGQRRINNQIQQLSSLRGTRCLSSKDPRTLKCDLLPRRCSIFMLNSISGWGWLHFPWMKWNRPRVETLSHHSVRRRPMIMKTTQSAAHNPWTTVGYTNRVHERTTSYSISIDTGKRRGTFEPALRPTILHRTGVIWSSPRELILFREASEWRWVSWADELSWRTPPFSRRKGKQKTTKQQQKTTKSDE